MDEKQKGNITRKVLCPQCKAEYIVVFPSMGAFVALLDALEEITHKISPFIAGGVLLGSIYWIAITYGAVTVMQVCYLFFFLYKNVFNVRLYILFILLPLYKLCIYNAESGNLFRKNLNDSASSYNMQI